jgi:hypothetical protein
VAAVAREMSRFVREVQDTCDEWLATYYHSLVFLLLGGMVVFTASRGYRLASDWEQWTVGEWLVSYSGGFVRRGLSGELMLAASRGTGVPVNFVVFTATIALFAAFCILFARLLRGKQITFWYLFLCLSPASLLFTLYNPLAVGRQELLIYVTFVLWASASRRGSLSRHTLIGFGVLAFAATLVHEMFFLFTPYFVLLSFLLFTSGGGGGEWKQALIVPASSAAAVGALLLFSRSLDARALCDRITDAGAPAKVCNGIFEYGDPRISNQVVDFVGHFNGHVLLSLVLIFPIVLLPVYLFLAANRHEAMPSSRLIATLCAFVVFSAPLFVLAVDWGRWIAIHAVLTTITCTLLLIDRVPTPAREPRPSPVAAGYLLAGLLMLSTTLLWSVNYCCGDEYLNALGPVHELRAQLREAGI